MQKSFSKILELGDVASVLPDLNSMCSMLKAKVSSVAHPSVDALKASLLRE